MEPRILLIDHHEPMLYSMWQYLTAHGCRSDCARSLDEAESLWSRQRYDVIVTDLRFRGIDENDGLKLVSYIHERCPTSKLMLLTHYGNPHLEQEARRRGVVGFLYPGSEPEDRDATGLRPEDFV